MVHAVLLIRADQIQAVRLETGHRDARAKFHPDAEFRHRLLELKLNKNNSRNEQWNNKIK